MDVIKNFEGIFLLAVFVLLFIVLWKSLQESSLFPDGMCIVLALVGSLICLVSLNNFLTEGQNSSSINTSFQEGGFSSETKDQEREFILLPWLVLAISIMASLIFMAFIKVWTAIKDFFNLPDKDFKKAAPKWPKATNDLTSRGPEKNHKYNIQNTLSDDPQRTER